MSAYYLGVTCKRCGGRFGKSLAGRGMLKLARCPYCGYSNRVKESHFVLFSTADELRLWVSKAAPVRSRSADKRERKKRPLDS